jgi:peroxiredoxin
MLLCLGLCACAGTLPSAGATQPLELALTRSDGRRIELSELRGKPTLLLFFATYDQASQFVFAPLTRFAELDSRVQVLGVALQPDAKTFLKLFEESVSVPFALYYDADNQVLHKQTALGALEGVPALVALDANGRIRGTHYGIATSEQLQALAQRSLD